MAMLVEEMLGGTGGIRAVWAIADDKGKEPKMELLLGLVVDGEQVLVRADEKEERGLFLREYKAASITRPEGQESVEDGKMVEGEA